jgi:RimJ/RimL family protein N-acetyltransferase
MEHCRLAAEGSALRRRRARREDLEGAASHPEAPSMVLRDVTMSDLPIFFDQQLDPEANWMATFIAKDPADRDAFMARWTRMLRDETITIQTTLFDGQVAGSVLSYVDEDGQPEVSYWIGKPYWGKGIVTRALSAFLDHIKERPLYARAAKDNVGSLRVLEKCGFTRIGQDKGFSNARGEEVEEYILRLDYLNFAQISENMLGWLEGKE